MHSEAIDPAGVEWTRVDEKLITVRLITGVAGWLIWLVVPAVALTLTLLGIWDIWAWLLGLVLAVLLIWAVIDLALVPRRVRAIGYCERQDDLLIRTGILWQRVVAVPYGYSSTSTLRPGRSCADSPSARCS